MTAALIYLCVGVIFYGICLLGSLVTDTPEGNMLGAVAAILFWPFFVVFWILSCWYCLIMWMFGGPS